MKNFLLTISVFITVVMFSSCAKDTTGVVVHEDSVFLKDTIILHDTLPHPIPSPYYIRASINGDTVNYNVGALAQSSAPSDIQIFGSASTNSNADHLDIIFEYQGNGIPYVGIGTYTDTAYNFIHSTVTGNPYGGGAQLQISGIIYNSFPGNFGAYIPPVFTCAITALDSISVSGTFSGEVTYGSAPGYTYKTITNGSFYVPF